MKWWKEYKKPWSKRIYKSLPTNFPLSESVCNLIVLYAIPYHLVSPVRLYKKNNEKKWGPKYETWIQIAIKLEFEFFQAAANEGHTAAQAELACLYEYGATPARKENEEASYNWAVYIGNVLYPRDKC